MLCWTCQVHIECTCLDLIIISSSLNTYECSYLIFSVTHPNLSSWMKTITNSCIYESGIDYVSR